jgi:hypothetical protein
MYIIIIITIIILKIIIICNDDILSLIEIEADDVSRLPGMESPVRRGAVS